MSRLRKLKERKNRIKATACGLSLALAVGLAQDLGTYALFTDTEEVSSDLAISTGDVDVELSSNSDNINSEFTGNTYTKQFKIANNGTLNQNIQLKLDMVLGEGLNDSDWIDSYEITFDSGIEPINNLFGNETYVDLKDNTTKELFTLNPGKEITATISIKTKNKNLSETKKQELANKSFELQLNIKAIQIGIENIKSAGFYDIEVRTDKFTIAPMIFGITFKDDGTRLEYITIDFDNFVGKPKNITLAKKSGQFNNGDMTWSLSNSSLNIRADLYNTSQKKWYIDNTFTDKHYLIFAFEYEMETRYFKFEFKVGANSIDRNPSVDVKITEVDSSLKALSEPEILTITNKIEDVESTNIEAEVKVPTESDTIEQPKVDGVEVSTESDVIEQSKDEEVEVSTKSNLLEQPKEEIQVILPSQTDVIEERKE